MTKLSLIITVLLQFGAGLQSQSLRTYALEVSCKARTINSSQSVLEFRWPYRGTTAFSQQVFRKNKSALTWGSVYKYLNVSDSSFNDTILTGAQFEYRFEKDSAPDGSVAQGYCLSGNRVPAVFSRGRIVMLADSLHKSYLANEIRTYRNDLTGDGWYTELIWLDSNTTVNQIKAIILNRYNTGTIPLHSVVLIGHLAVPYSGDLSSALYYPPDGHSPDHDGAWPSDMFYSCINVPYWQDSAVTNTTGSRAANRNYPSDGKFDYSMMQDFNTLQIGRIDLSDMPVFGTSERDLLKRYFTKNHRFRHKQDVLRERCLVDDNFGLLGSSGFREHFANNAYRNMAPLVSDTVTYNLDYRTTLNTNDYLFSFGFGSGAYDLCTGIGYTSQLADSTKQIKSVFSGFLGSYFIDFDNTNNFIRAPLAAKGHVLNTFQCGRPDMFLHHMGLGETIGYSQLRTWNDFDIGSADYLYPTTSYGKLYIHTNLMGDPAVRMQPVYPASHFTVWQDSCNQRVKMTWTASPDTAVHKYYILRARHIDSVFTLIGSTAGTAFTDSFPIHPEGVYMLRAEKLQLSGSGYYFNLSQGIFDTARLIQLQASADTAVCLNTVAGIGRLQNNSSSVVYNWSPDSSSSSVLQTTVTANSTYILTASDTVGHCTVRDTISVAVLPLPQKDSMYYANNACSDTLVWSSTGINGGGYAYNWSFPGANPSVLSGHMLYTPGVVVYAIPGNYAAYLTVSDTLTMCSSRDTSDFTVVCSSLPYKQASVECVNTINNKTISFYVFDETDYVKYIIEIGEENNWKLLKELTALGTHLYRFETVSMDGSIRISGMDASGQQHTIGYCHQNEAQGFKLFPNPGTDVLNMEANTASNHLESTIEIIDFQGRKTFSTGHVFANGRLSIPVEQWSAGVYHISVMHQNKPYNYTFIKQ